MSRRTRERRLEAEASWPTLAQFLGGYLHEDWPEDYGTPEAAIDKAVSEYPLALRQTVLREWSDWNAKRSWKGDLWSAIGEGFGVRVHFKTDEDARAFMNQVYDKLIVSVREETTRDWKP